MVKKRVGKQSVQFEEPPIIAGYASVAGKKESQGPQGKYYDIASDTDLFEGNNWEEAESRMQLMAANTALEKASIKSEDIDYIVAGDLLGQLQATSFGIKQLEIPLFGVYGACSTMGESLALSAMLIDGDYADKVVCLTSSHFATAEKQFRFPLGYGNQRPLSATTTVTGSGALVITSQRDNKYDSEKTQLIVSGITTGKVVDYGIKDPNNMGAAMAPAAFDLICRHAKDFDTDFSDYDSIITGDLGMVGCNILYDMLKTENISIENIHMDCGMHIYDRKKQDAHSGGSGCGCAAITLCGPVLKKMMDKAWRKVLFIPTGALMSTVSFHEGNTIPGIAHGVLIEAK